MAERQQTFDGTKARKLRISLGLNVQEVAEQIGVSTDAIYKYEQLNANPKPAAYRKLTELYGVEPLGLWLDDEAGAA